MGHGERRHETADVGHGHVRRQSKKEEIIEGNRGVGWDDAFFHVARPIERRCVAGFRMPKREHQDPLRSSSGRGSGVEERMLGRL